MADRKLLPGLFVWFEHVSPDVKKAQAFYAEVFGWRVEPFPMGESKYDMIYTGDTMIGGYMPQTRGPAHWISYVSVEDVDAAAKTAAASGGKVIEPPFDIPPVGRTAKIADPQGAELYLFKNREGDPPDGDAPNGGFFWNELHTTDAKGALAFYAKVVGYGHTAKDMGPAGVYYVISGSGADRGGVSSHLGPGVRPHWLPYVKVDDPDATIARAKKLGAKIAVELEDIPNVGRFAMLQDPTGAMLAVMKPKPM
jgi:predicted enzyme related to lactoylglutathione lyase